MMPRYAIVETEQGCGAVIAVSWSKWKLAWMVRRWVATERYGHYSWYDRHKSLGVIHYGGYIFRGRRETWQVVRIGSDVDGENYRKYLEKDGAHKSLKDCPNY